MGLHASPHPTAPDCGRRVGRRGRAAAPPAPRRRPDSRRLGPSRRTARRPRLARRRAGPARAWRQRLGGPRLLRRRPVRRRRSRAGRRPRRRASAGGRLTGRPELAAGRRRAPARAGAGARTVDVAHCPNPAGVRRIFDFASAWPAGFESVDEAASAGTVPPYRQAPDGYDGLRRTCAAASASWHWDPALVVELAAVLTPGAARASATWPLRPGPLPDPARARRNQRDVVSETLAAEFCEVVPAAELVEVPGAGQYGGRRSERPLHRRHRPRPLGAGWPAMTFRIDSS